MKHSKLIMAILIGGIITACKPDYQEQLAAVNTARITKVKVTSLAPGQEPLPIVASGVLASKSQAMLSFKVGGIVDAVMADEGESFRRGQVLARLEMTEINARVSQAEEKVTKLRRDQQRTERLYADTVATLEQLQDITTALELADSDLKIATYNQEYAQVVAREDGKVLRRMTERGELISPGTPAFQIAYKDGRSSHIIKVGVADKDVVKLQTGDSSSVTFDAYPGGIFKAFVSEIAEAADPRTGVFEIELTLEDSRYQLRDGFVAKLEIYPSGQEAYYRVPMSALVEGNGEEAVIYVSAGNTVKRMKIHPTLITDEFFVVKGNEVSHLDSIVTQGVAYARPGELVEIIK
jgi:RND family efflux transporter MFP subunit